MWEGGRVGEGQSAAVSASLLSADMARAREDFASFQPRPRAPARRGPDCLEDKKHVSDVGLFCCRLGG